MNIEGIVMAMISEYPFQLQSTLDNLNGTYNEKVWTKIK